MMFNPRFIEPGQEDAAPVQVSRKVLHVLAIVLGKRAVAARRSKAAADDPGSLS
jgi:hypothetical protein